MVVCWVAASFNFYLITFFMKYIPGSIFLNTCFSSISESSGKIVAGVYLGKFGPRKALSFVYLVSCISGIILLICI